MRWSNAFKKFIDVWKLPCRGMRVSLYLSNTHFSFISRGKTGGGCKYVLLNSKWAVAEPHLLKLQNMTLFCRLFLLINKRQQRASLLHFHILLHFLTEIHFLEIYYSNLDDICPQLRLGHLHPPWTGKNRNHTLLPKLSAGSFLK